MKKLYDGKMKPEEKENFLGNVVRVLDLFDGLYIVNKNYLKEDTNMCQENEVVPAVEVAVEEVAVEVAVEEVAAPVVEEVAVEEVVPAAE
jgi:hypothetical protein